MNTTTRQRRLPFDVLYANAKDRERAERLARILSTDKRITTGAKLFDFEEATRVAHRVGWSELVTGAHSVVADDEIAGKDPSSYGVTTYDKRVLPGV